LSCAKAALAVIARLAAKRPRKSLFMLFAPIFRSAP
jgi:hypothetical protein